MSVAKTVGQTTSSTDPKTTPVPSIEIWRPSLHERLIIYMLGVTSLIVAMDASIIPTTLSSMVNDLEGDSTQAFWIGTSYLLVNAVTMPFICSVSDIFGRPICFEFSLAMFSLGTVICCTANSIVHMLVGRCIQGIGGAGIHALGLVILTDIVPLSHRPKWYGVTLGGWAIGLSLGPIIGGGIVEHASWRVIFYIMFPICALGLILTPWLLTLKPKTATLKEKLARVDWLGGILFMCSATSFLIGVSWGGIQYDWNSAQTIAPIVLGALGMIMTVFYENHFARDPYLRKSLWQDWRIEGSDKLNWSAIVTYINGCLQGLAMFGFLYYVPLYFLSVKGQSPLEAGVDVLALLLPTLLSAIVTGRLITRTRNYRWAICVGWFIACIGTGFLLVWSVHSSTVFWAFSQIILGVGTGAVLNAQNFACQAMCKPADGTRTGEEGVAAAMYLFSRQFGFALGVGIGGTAFQNVMALKLEWEGLPVDPARHAEGYVAVLSSMQDGHEKASIREAYEFGFMGCFSVFLGVSVVALILSLIFVEQFDMNRAQDSEHKLQPRRAITKAIDQTSQERTCKV
ncbi:hypothetical protein JX265_011575 [Neoarthrinium moseri]|uniref:Major facilitator superfamily (MFS) profile domain-containing protein n=1 Tax=Neoarthrinium moseri TaxID=1658444 RepID=A0A9Q0AJK9_9PEZI|nr:uncharacterized protein JN550_011675 [Neoarthrinium moseri]KAI1848571.1 hypothetical protein JX266_005430 [Neoarthrinium moseri]KAI1856616.1 hypothetical protein JX265_011575 [Neoarthrinium moseri]KAI1859991.1 hypothetical protein JN550_011675 [Neoarthrinium moseri]